MNQQDLFKEVWNLKEQSDNRRDILARRYSEAWGFYRGALPAIKRKGDLPAREIMRQSFDSTYPSLVALFTDSQKSPVVFDSDSQDAGNIDLAKSVSRAIHDAAMKTKASYYKLMLKAIKEILIAGDQAAYVGIGEQDEETKKHSFTDAPIAQVAIAADLLRKQGYDVDSQEEVNESAQTVTGWIQGKKTIRFPVINLIDFKDYYLDPRAYDSEDAEYQAFAEQISEAEGKRRKYKSTAVEESVQVDTNFGRSTDKSLMVVGDMNNEYLPTEYDSVISNNNNIITVWHHFWKGCYNSSKAEWHYVVTNESCVLHTEVISYCPVFKGGMSIVNGSGWSESLFDFCKSSQVATTRAARAIQRSADNAAYGVYMYVESMMNTKGKAALSARGAGSNIPVQSLNAIAPLATPDVPRAMEILNEQLQQDADKQIQGSAGQAQALEENSQASGTAIALTQNKQELNESQIAKTIAETFIKPMYQRLFLVLQELDKPIQMNGQQIPLSLISKDMGLSIDVQTANDRANAAQSVFNAYTALAQLQAVPANIQQEGVYNIIADYFRAATGQEDVSNYITAPEDMPQPGKVEKMMEAVLKLAQVRAQVAETRLAEAKVDDMQADTQKKFNDAAKDLAQIQQILAEIKQGEMGLYLQYLKDQNDAAAKTAQNAQGQEQIDKQ